MKRFLEGKAALRRSHIPASLWASGQGPKGQQEPPGHTEGVRLWLGNGGIPPPTRYGSSGAGLSPRLL